MLVRTEKFDYLCQRIKRRGNYNASRQQLPI